MNTLDSTYYKSQGGGQIAGYTYLKDVLIRISDEEDANGILKTISWTLGHHNSFLGLLDDTIVQELSEHIYEVIYYTPLTHIAAHSENQTLHGKIAELGESKVPYIH